MAPQNNQTISPYPLPDVNRGSYALITHSTFTSLAIVIVAFRCAARLSTSRLQTDDHFTVGALACAILNLIFTVIGTSHGVGRHIVYLDIPDTITGVRALFLGEFLLIIALCLIKISVLVFLLNFRGIKKWLRWTLYTNMFIICASTLAFVIVLWAQCTPARANWDPTVKSARCISIRIFMNATYALTAITVLTDFLCALLPFPIIWKLQLNLKAKLSLMALIGLGIFAAACSVVRIALVKNIEHSREDPTWLMIPLGVWTVIELHIAIIVASIPPCRTLFLRLWGNVKGQTYQSSSYDARSGSRSGKKGSYLPNKGNSSIRVYDGRESGWVRMDRLGDGASERSETSRVPLQRG